MSRSPRLLWLGLILMACAGCQSVPFFSGMNYPEADLRHPVVEILCVWQPAEGRGLDNLPCRGFGGQVLFFSAGRKEPVKVEGDVRIYVFDEQGVNSDASKPIHQFDFPAAVWNTFLRPSNLGASYQIFVPYTRKGVHSSNCSLRVQFTPEGGLPVYSRFATVNLVGHDAAFLRREQAKAEQVVTVSHDQKQSAGDGVVTADWSDRGGNGTSTVNEHEPSRFPGIPVGEISRSSRQSQMISQLRNAAQRAEASTSEGSGVENAAFQQESISTQLHRSASTAAAVAPSHAVSSVPGSSATTGSTDSPEVRSTVPSHPLAE